MTFTEASALLLETQMVWVLDGTTCFGYITLIKGSDGIDRINFVAGAYIQGKPNTHALVGTNLIAPARVVEQFLSPYSFAL